MKKNILIHIGSLNAGGAEKSLISMLNLLPSDRYNIDLLLLRNEGLFKNLIPSHVNIVPLEFPYQCLGISLKNIRYYLTKSPNILFKKIFSIVKTKLNRSMAADQVRWGIWKDIIGTYSLEYDVAISYLEGVTNYYIIDKVKAKRKILWVHNEYTKLGYNKDFDSTYFRAADSVVTISELCLRELQNHFPLLKNKFDLLENITDPLLVRRMAEMDIIDEQFDKDFDGINLISIGRLYYQKNFDLAVETARVLKDKGIRFKWYIIGEGELRVKLQSKIDKFGLKDCFKLLGLRANPYQYVKRCDIVVQTSLYEGKSIVLDEAKVLYKPIVSTNYTTVYNVITDHHNGIIADMKPESLAKGICELVNEASLRTRIIKNLELEHKSNITEIRKYTNLIDNIG